MFRMLNFFHKKSAFLIILALSSSISGCGLKGPLYQTPEKSPANQMGTEETVNKKATLV